MGTSVPFLLASTRPALSRPRGKAENYRISNMTRARKAGDQAAIERKLEERYDAEEALGTPEKVTEWINKVMDGEAGYAPCTGTSWQIIQKFLQDGVVLCKLLNKLRAAAGMEKISFKANAKMAFVQMGNVEAFNKGAESYGVPSSALFQTVDLMDGRKGPMINVVNCLNQLGFEANKKGFEPHYEHVAAPTIE